MPDKESQIIEFKPNWRDEYLRTLCAFANSDGGKLIIGIDDKSNFIGVKNSKKLLENLPNKIKSVLGITPNVEIKKNKGKDTIIVQIDPSSNPISYHGKFYKRSGSTNQVLEGYELSEFLSSKSGKTWDELFEEKATIDDMDFETIKKFKKLAIQRLPSIKDEEPIKILKKLDLIENGKIKRACILLFGKNPKRFNISAYVRIGKFKSPTEIVASDDIEGNLFQQLEHTIEFLRTKYLILEIKGINKDWTRKEELEYPEPALREAIINALIHRSYIGGEPTEIRIYPDYLSVWNYGKLPEGVRIDELKSSHKSIRRNKLIADIFFKADLIEAWGRGTIKIVEECQKAELPEPEFKEEFLGFSVYFYKDIYTEDNLKKMGLNERQIKAVLYVKEKGKITNREYREMFGITDRTALNDLNDLCLKDILERVGTTGRKTRYVFRKTRNKPEINPKNEK